jgi:hypothetical protein
MDERPGISIDPKYHEHIFEMFACLHNPHLPACRTVHRHGGQICMESTSGKSSVF